VPLFWILFSGKREKYPGRRQADGTPVAAGGGTQPKAFQSRRRGPENVPDDSGACTHSGTGYPHPSEDNSWIVRPFLHMFPSKHASPAAPHRAGLRVIAFYEIIKTLCMMLVDRAAFNIYHA
jgi:hypothetical protein